MSAQDALRCMFRMGDRDRCTAEAEWVIRFKPNICGHGNYGGRPDSQLYCAAHWTTKLAQVCDKKKLLCAEHEEYNCVTERMDVRFISAERL